MAKAAELQEAGTRPLHITIVTHPAGAMDLEQELRLAKAALLYADRVKLYSLKASMLQAAAHVGDLSPRHQLRIIEGVAPFLMSGEESRSLIEGLQAYKGPARTKRRTREQLLRSKKFEALLKQQWEHVKQVGQSKAREAGLTLLEPATQLGLLELHCFEGTNTPEGVSELIIDCVARASRSPHVHEHAAEMSSRDEMVIAEFVEAICHAVLSGATHPLFDEQTGHLVNDLARQRIVAPSETAIGRGRHSGLAGHLLTRLPSFDRLSMEEVISVRKELQRPLVRFRAAVIRFADEICSASWSEDFPADAEEVFHRDVRPAVLEIEEAVESNRFLASLLRKAVDERRVEKGTLVGLVLSSILSLPADLSATIGAGLAGLSVVYDAFEEWKKKNKEVERNAMYFYYRVGQRTVH